MTAAWSVTLPIRTVSESNAREHWAAKAKRVKQHRTTAGLVVRARGLVSLPAHVLLVRIAPRTLDDDNLRGALKAIRDGVADALGVDDRDPRVTWAYGQRRGAPRAFGVQVTLVSGAEARSDPGATSSNVEL